MTVKSPAPELGFKSIYSDGVPTQPVGFFPVVYGAYNQVSGRSNNGYKKKIASKLDASSPYFRSGISKPVPVRLNAEITRYVGHPSLQTSHFGSASLGVHISSVPPFESSDASLDDIASKRFLKKYRDETADFNSLVPLAELREMRGLIRSLADITSNTLKDLIAIKRNPRNALKRASEIWLTYGFGIAPLLSDVRSVSQSIAAFLLRQDHVSRLSSSASKSWSSGPGVNDSYTWLPNMPLYMSTTLRHELSYRYIASWLFNLQSSLDSSLADHLGFDYSSLPSTFWELTPYSWVVDYFTTVGDYLDAEFSGTSGKALFFVKNRRYRCKIQTIYKGVVQFRDPPWTAFGQSNEGTLESEYFEFERSLQIGLPSRIVRFKTVDEIGKNSLNKLFNLASILATRR